VLVFCLDQQQMVSNKDALTKIYKRFKTSYLYNNTATGNCFYHIYVAATAGRVSFK